MILVFYFVILIALNTLGQLLLKQAANKGGFYNPFLWGGYFCFLITIALSFLLMRKMDLKYFTIIMSLNYVSVLFASSFWFNEKLTRSKLSGVLMVLLGIFVFMMDVVDVS